MPEVDLRQLAIDRSESASTKVRTRRHWLTRYVIPGALIAGFLSLVVWASWDVVFPPRRVTVVPVLVTQADVQPSGTPLFNAAGWVEPRPTPVRVAALAPGVVEQLLVVEDQPVKAGEPVAELVKDDAQLAYERSLADQQLREAELEQARASLTAAQTRFEQPVHLQAELGDADAALAKIETELKNLPFETQRARARLAFARTDYEGKLAAKEAIAGRLVDAAKSELDTAQALVDELHDRDASLESERTALRARRDALQAKLQLLADETQAKEESAAQVKAATARLEQAKVAVAQAGLQLDRMTVRAPMDGRVYRLIGHPGARIGGDGGMTHILGHDSSTIVTMYRPESLQVRVDVRFEDIPHVSLAQPVEIDNPALSEPLVGKVLFVSSQADIQKNTLEVKVAIDEPVPVFKPEMLVDVTFLAPETAAPSQEPSEATRLYVPQALVKQGEDGTFVWLADQSAGRAHKLPVTTGVVGVGGLIEITSGLTAASRLIASGTEDLAEGDRILVSAEESSLPDATPTGRGSHAPLQRLPAGGSP